MDKKKSIMDYETVALDEEKGALVIIDQTKLPYETELLTLYELTDIWNAIYLLQVRGAPAIGVAAAIGIYLEAKKIKAEAYEEFYRQFKKARDYLDTARPTAVNLSWALNRMEQVCIRNREKPVMQIKEGGYVGLQNDRRIRAIPCEARGWTVDALQCGTACDDQIRNGDCADVSRTGTRLSF